MKHHRVAGWLAVVLAWPAVCGAAPPPATELTLREALRMTLEQNPQLRGQPSELAAIAARGAQVALRPLPELGVELENFAGTGGHSAARALETSVTLSQLIELGGKQQARRELLDSEQDVLRAEHRIRTLDVLAETIRRFVRLAAAQEQLALAHSATALAETSFKAIEARVQAARSPLAEQSRAAIVLERMRMEEAQTRREVENAKMRLAVMWGAQEPQFGTARADLQNIPAVDTFAELTQHLSGTPQILRYLSAQRLAQAQVQLARVQRRPDVRVGAGVRRFEESDDQALLLSFSMPLAFGAQQRTLATGLQLEAQARRNTLDNERDAALLEARAELFGFYQEMDQSREALSTLNGKLIPLARTALEQTEYGYERGRFSWLEVAAAQRELLDLQRAAIEAAAAFHLLLAEIERLTAEAVATPTQEAPKP